MIKRDVGIRINCAAFVRKQINEFINNFIYFHCQIKTGTFTVTRTIIFIGITKNITPGINEFINNFIYFHCQIKIGTFTVTRTFILIKKITLLF